MNIFVLAGILLLLISIVITWFISITVGMFGLTFGVILILVGLCIFYKQLYDQNKEGK